MVRSRRQFQRPQWVTPRGARWLLGTSPVLLVLLIFAIKALSMIGVNSAGITAYDEGRFGASRSSFAQLRVGNLFQPWIADYNRGTAEYGLRDYPAARASFTAALERVPADYECRVVLNLVATIERQGDELAAQQQPREAVQHYEDALRLLADSDCGEPTSTPSPSPEPSSSPSPDEPSPDPSSEPSSDPSGEPSSDPSGEPSTDPSGEPDPDSEPQSDEERREEEAQRKQEQEQRIGEKADEQRKNSERRDRDPSPSSEPEPSQEPDSDPSGEQQRREELEQRNQEGQQEQSRRRDRDERPDQRSDTPW